MNSEKHIHSNDLGESSHRVRDLIIDAVFAAGGLLIWVCFAVLVLSDPWH
jgi:hypothetical protein